MPQHDYLVSFRYGKRGGNTIDAAGHHVVSLDHPWHRDDVDAVAGTLHPRKPGAPIIITSVFALAQVPADE